MSEAADKYLAIVAPSNAALAEYKKADLTTFADVQKALAPLADAEREFSVELAQVAWPTSVQPTADDLIAALGQAHIGYLAVQTASDAEGETALKTLGDQLREASGIADTLRVRLGLPSVPAS